MAAENAEMTPASYIGHHLKFMSRPVHEDGGFWTLHLDTLITSVILGTLVLGFLFWITRGATSGVPGKRQAFVELCVEFVNDQVRSIFHRDIRFIAPLALTVFLWVLFMNAMDFLPVDIMARALGFFGIHEYRLVPTADVNATFALALSVWLLMIFFAIKVKGLGGFIHELFFAPFGAPKLTTNPVSWILVPLAMMANFLMQMIEYVSKPLSHSLRLFGNMYAGEIIFLLLWLWAAHVTFAGGLLSDFGAVVSFASTVVLGLGWSIFHILIVALQAFIFMMLTVVYISMAHEHH